MQQFTNGGTAGGRDASSSSAERVLDDAYRAVCEGRSAVLATIVAIRGSSSQPLASRMAIVGERWSGNVSGGCVESDVALRAQEVAADGVPRMVEYHRVTDPLFEVGLNCEGSIDVVLEPATVELIDALRASGPRVVETRVRPGHDGTVSVTHLHDERSGMDVQSVQTRASSEVEADGTIVLREPVGMRHRLLIFGASDIATVLASLASRVGFDVTVADPRADLVTRERHPDAGDLIAGWPPDVFARHAVDSRTYVVSLNHEPRFEDAIFVALMSQERPAYIGAIGKRARAEERAARQAQSGFDLARLPEVHTPIGLPIGGKSPEDIAVSILAQLVAVRAEAARR